MSKATFSYLDTFAWRRVVGWLRRKHHRASWSWLRRHYLPAVATDGGHDDAVQPGQGDGHPLPLPGEPNPDSMDDGDGARSSHDRRLNLWRAGCGGSRTSGSEGRARETTGREVRAAPWPDPLRVGQTPSRPPGIGYTALANGFATCDHPDELQAICDRFGPGDVQAFFDRWIDLIPTPFTARRPGRRLLVGTVDASGRGVPHPGVR